MSNDSSESTPPGPALGYLLKHATMQLTASTDAALEPFDIDSKDLGVLQVLVGREPTSQQQVAESLGVDRTTMVALLDTLEAKGVVTRRPDPADRRRNVVELTEPGLAMFGTAKAAYESACDEFVAPLGADLAGQFRRALHLLVTR